MSVTISAADVAKLRKITNSGMMDCKQALQEAEGDFDKAIELLRKKGQKIAAKREDRETTEGVVLSGVTADGKNGVLLCIGCETDFVAKNEEFVNFAKSILAVALANKPATAEDLKALQLGGVAIADAINDRIGAVGEKVEISSYSIVEAAHVFAYIHSGNRLATLVGFNKTVAVEQVGKDIAMQIAAMSPVAIDKDDCPTDIIEKEIEIGKEQARQEGKPEAMLEKIALGKLNKFYDESTLLNQEFVKEGKTKVRQYIQSADKDLTVTVFRRFGL